MTAHKRFWSQTLPACVLLFSLLFQGAGLAFHRASHEAHAVSAATTPCDHAHTAEGLDAAAATDHSGTAHQHPSGDAHAGDLCLVCAGLESSALLLTGHALTTTAQRNSNVRSMVGTDVPTLIPFRLALARAPPPAG